MKTFEELKEIITTGRANSGFNISREYPPIEVSGTFVAKTARKIGIVPVGVPVIAWRKHSSAGSKTDTFTINYYAEGDCRVEATCSAGDLDMLAVYAETRSAILANVTTEDLASELDARRGYGEFVIVHLFEDCEIGNEYRRLLDAGYVHYNSEHAGKSTFITLRRSLQGASMEVAK